MSKLRLSFGCWNYNRTRALMDGSVQADGIDLDDLSSYTVSPFKPGRPLVAIPVYPSRFVPESLESFEI